MESRYRFVGTARAYRNLREVNRWGGFYLENSARSGRKRLLHPGDCPFCGMTAGMNAGQSLAGRLNFAGEEYLVVDNSNPIIERQILLIPARVKNDLGYSDHRLDLNAQDVNLALNLGRRGFREIEYTPPADSKAANKTILREDPAEIFGQPWACYVNTLPGTGRSVAHLHINCVPAHYIPLLPDEVAAWQVCRSENGSALSQLAGVSFYALAVENSDDERAGQTVAEIHRYMNEWQQPYNFLAYPASNQNEPNKVRLVIVPRDNEYCEAADQRVAGLEFLTGVLVPGSARLKVMDTILRDRALLQATLKRTRQLALERLLRGLYGLPASGYLVRAVRALPGDQFPFKAAVEPNDVLTAVGTGAVGVAASVGGSLPTTCRSPSDFGAIESSSWRLPRRATTEIGFRAKWLNANVLVRITRASICQSDRRVLAGEKPKDVVGWALGHEGGGYVVDPGPWDSELAAGEKVVILPHLSCGECEACHRYLPNLCEMMRHLGFHLNGNMADLMAFPYQCVLPVGIGFPEDALPLVEPLACVLRALFRIRLSLRRLADTAEEAGSLPNFLTIFGSGPMGCLVALAVRRSWPSLRIRMIEPNTARRQIVASRKLADQVLESVPHGERSSISFVACSNFQASIDAIETTEFGGTVMLFSGINTNEQKGVNPEYQGKNLEQIHRREQSVVQEDAFGSNKTRLIGSSGYILDDVKRSIIELKRHYTTHYNKVQNVQILGLITNTASYGEPRSEDVVLPGNAIETLLSPRGVDDPYVSETLKVLIRL